MYNKMTIMNGCTRAGTKYTIDEVKVSCSTVASFLAQCAEEAAGKIMCDEHGEFIKAYYKGVDAFTEFLPELCMRQDIYGCVNGVAYTVSRTNGCSFECMNPYMHSTNMQIPLRIPRILFHTNSPQNQLLIHKYLIRILDTCMLHDASEFC